MGLTMRAGNRHENRAYRLIKTLVRYRRIMFSTTRIELAKRYSGSFLGMIWVLLYPALLLSVYLFVYLVVFKMRFPGYRRIDYVLYVFCGLIPYIGFSEAVMTGCVSIKQNMHLVKNVILPIELIPVRAVATSLPSQCASMLILLVLVGLNGSLSWQLIALPIVFLLQVLFLIGLVFVLASVAVALPDLVYFVNLFLLFLMFVSPIGFKPEMLPSSFQFMVYLNPIYYMVEMFRIAILGERFRLILVPAVFSAMCLLVFSAGCAFFYKFKGILVDYE